VRTSHICPKCSHNKVAHVPTIRDTDCDRMTLGRVSVWTGETTGDLEAWICMRCGYTELYVSRPEALQIDKLEGATVLEHDPQQGPFR
jgi:predicted nucleic-acid-binding Zn-ribbon protein